MVASEERTILAAEKSLTPQSRVRSWSYESHLVTCRRRQVAKCTQDQLTVMFPFHSELRNI